MSIARYMQVTERLRDAKRRGLDVDHYVDELHGLWSAMDADARKQVREERLLDDAEYEIRWRTKHAA